MKATRTLASFLIGLVGLGGSPAPGCVVDIRTPLWEQIRTAELVALVRVEMFEKEPVRPTGAIVMGSEGGQQGFEPNVAVLKILESWKGPSGGEIRLNYSEFLHAGGRRVVAGDRILVLLESGEAQIRHFREERQKADEATTDVSDAAVEALEAPEAVEVEAVVDDSEFERLWEESRTGRWFLASAGPGTLALESADEDSLRDLVAEAVGLQAGAAVPEEAQRAWLVRAAALRPTRAAAILDLQHIVRPSEDGKPASEEARLSEEELRTIADGFNRSPGADWSMPALMELLAEYRDDEFERTLISVIEAGVAAPRIPAWIPEAIRLLIVRCGWHDWGSQLWDRYRVKGTLQSIWLAVARDLQLPSVPAARVRIGDTEPE